MAAASAAAAALLLLLLLASGADCAASRQQQQQQDGGGYLVEGRVRVEALADKVAASVKLLLNGGQRVTFLQPGGYFAFHGVPPGTHLLEVVAPGYSFAPVRLDVSERLRGDVQAIYTETRRMLPDPLLLEPAQIEQYYEKREPFSVLGLLKSPMGLMVGFMGLAVFVLPKLMDSIDPEEMKRVQEEMRNRPAPSFSNLLQGRSS